jgi:hypothetical protein
LSQPCLISFSPTVLSKLLLLLFSFF